MKTMYSVATETLNHEKDLLASISEGNATAYAELFNAYSVRLAPYLSKLLNSDFWAEEIVQDVFLKIWAHRHRLREIENPPAYIYRMAANRAHDLIKKQALEVKLQYHISRRAGSEGKNFTEELADFHFSEQLFSAAVNNLPAQQQLVYKLRHEEGLGYEEIKTRLNISKNTVRNQLVSALDNIRSYILRREGLLVLLIFALRLHR